MANTVYNQVRVVFLALLFVFGMDHFTNAFPIQWDASHYLEISLNGIMGNPNLVAPFAYRPGMPLLCRLLGTVFGLTAIESFWWMTRFFAVLLLLVFYATAWRVTRSASQSILLMILMGLAAQHIKIPLYFSSLVDIAAYPLFGLSFGLLFFGYPRLAGLVATAALPFKEFLAIPWFLACIQLFFLQPRTQRPQALAFLIGGLLILVGLRVLIPVASSVQFIDPLHDFESIRKLWEVWFDSERLFNLCYANLVYWLPVLILVRCDRLQSLKALNDMQRILLIGTMALVELLALYGGTNLMIFVSYGFPVEIVVLGLFARSGLRLREWAVVLISVFLWNKPFFEIPSPDLDMNAYLDYWGGYDSRVNVQSGIKLASLFVLIAIARGLSGWETREVKRNSLSGLQGPFRWWRVIFFWAPFALFLVGSLWIIDQQKERSFGALTGDEPHYLMVSDSLSQSGTLDQMAAYQREFKNHKLYSPGLGRSMDQPNAANTHAVFGTHGFFNFHSIGLPLLLTLPYAYAGITGAKVFLVFLSCFLIFWIRDLARFLGADRSAEWATLVLLGSSLPLLVASSQIYPDLLAGALAFWLLLGLFKIETPTVTKAWVLAISLALLPWLHIKYVATALLLLMGWIYRYGAHRWGASSRMAVTFCASLALLGFYNAYAFGNPTGPYPPGSMVFGWPSLMVFLGLLIDQNQGFLLQNPATFLGVASLGALFKARPRFMLLWGLVFLSLLLPNALHTNWYGGGSINGRFGWSAFAVFMIPSVHGIIYLSKEKRKVWIFLSTLFVALQILFFYEYGIEGSDLYRKDPSTLPGNYSALYAGLADVLPMLYAPSWALGFLPNYLWAFGLLVLFVMGFFPHRSGLFRPLLVLSAMMIAVSGIFPYPVANEWLYSSAELPSQTGQILDQGRSANPLKDAEGLINYGPYLPLGIGYYEVSLEIQGDSGGPVGTLNISDAREQKLLSEYPITGTSGKPMQVICHWVLANWVAHPIEVKTYWNGRSQLFIGAMKIRQRGLWEGLRDPAIQPTCAMKNAVTP